VLTVTDGAHPKVRRLEAVRSEPQIGVEELSEFGWWFSSGKLDDDWAMKQLLDVLRLTKQVLPDHLVVAKLVEMANEAPLECVQALGMMIEGDTQNWAVLGWRTQARDILTVARRSGNPEASQKAVDLVNRLGSRGYFDFGEILKERVP